MKIIYLILGVSFLIVVLTGCKKDSNNNENSSPFRVTGYQFFDNDILDGKVTIEYEGDRVINIREFYSDSTGGAVSEHYRMSVEYPDNNTGIITYYYKDMDGVWNAESKEEITFDGSNLISSVNSYSNDGIWIYSFKSDRQYDGNKLLNSVSSEYENGSWNPLWKNEYSYEGDKIMSSIESEHYTGSWEQSYKEVVNYSGDHFDNIVGYDMSETGWLNENKVVYQYEADHISRIDDYEFYEGAWDNTGMYALYTYDSDGNVESWDQMEDGDSWKIVFEYEKGTGNWPMLMFSSDDSWLYYQTVPMPTKSGSLRLDAISKMKKRFLSRNQH